MNSYNKLVAPRLLFPLILLPALAWAQDNSSWHHYGGSQHGMQYSSLQQITKDNVADLEEVWRVRTGELGQDSEPPACYKNEFL